MTRTERRAPAKVNLTLHVTGRRADGYHLLDSLVVFAGVSDIVSLAATADAGSQAGMGLTVSGPFAEGVPTDAGNLVLRAAELLRTRRGVTRGAALHLEKNLPHAAGIGSGSSDAAATLALLAEHWRVAPLPADEPGIAALGADVPVCCHAPAPMRMEGIGERLSAVPALPSAALLLVRPPVAVPTGPVFKALETVENPPMETMPEGADFETFREWLSRQRNDLEAPARKLAPEIDRVLGLLADQPEVALARMSGSGATCFGLVRDLPSAQAAAARIAEGRPGWWVSAAEML